MTSSASATKSYSSQRRIMCHVNRTLAEYYKIPCRRLHSATYVKIICANARGQSRGNRPRRSPVDARYAKVRKGGFSAIRPRASLSQPGGLDTRGGIGQCNDGPGRRSPKRPGQSPGHSFPPACPQGSFLLQSLQERARHRDCRAQLIEQHAHKRIGVVPSTVRATLERSSREKSVVRECSGKPTRSDQRSRKRHFRVRWRCRGGAVRVTVPLRHAATSEVEVAVVSDWVPVCCLLFIRSTAQPESEAGIPFQLHSKCFARQFASSRCSCDDSDGHSRRCCAFNSSGHSGSAGESPLRTNPSASSGVKCLTVARHGKLPPRRHEELPPPWIAEERANERGANHGKPVVE